MFFCVRSYQIFIGPSHLWKVEVTSYESPRGSERVKTEGVRLRQEVEGIAKVCRPARRRPTSKENKINKLLAQCKNSPNGPHTSAEELYSLGNKCTLHQTVLHTDMNVEICFRTLTLITIKSVCTLFQQKKLQWKTK